MEVLLLRKNRHLEHQLTMARLQVAEAGGELGCLLGVVHQWLEIGQGAGAGTCPNAGPCRSEQRRSDSRLKCCVSTLPPPVSTCCEPLG